MRLDIMRHSLIVSLWVATPVFAKEDVLKIYGDDEDMISLATGTTQSIATAPAVATVITAEEIERLGATTLAEVLATVPGLHVSTERAVSDIFVIRGFFHPFNVQVLVLINGIPVNDVVNGGRPQAWSMPVHDIARIEVIRGPGSALYGADAFAGVINIITKTAKNIDGAEVGLLGGSFDTAGNWLLYGNPGQDFEVALALEASTTQGYAKTVGADQQSRIDALFGTSASLAPGPLNTGRDDVNARIDLAQPNRWRFRAGYQGFHNVGTGAGIALALDPTGSVDVDLINADFTYLLPTTHDWEGEIQASYLRTVTQGDVTLLPAGTLRGLFPDGIRDAFTYAVDQFRLGGTFRYDGFSRHRLRFGAGLNYTTNTTDEKKNYLTNPSGLILPAGRFADTDMLGVEPALPDADRTDVYGFVQDEWNWAPDWNFTAGARIDHYSDFGTTVNPRLALVWNTAPDLTLKALYGRAFRAPAFFDLYGNSPFVLVGNPQIQPETINMLEFVALKNWTPRLTSLIDVFWYETNDLILIEPTDPLAFASPANNRNSEGTRGHGLEFEAQYHPTPAVRLKFNYAYQQSWDQETGARGTLAPEQQFYGEVNWRFQPHWQLNARVKWIFDPFGYTMTDLAVRRTEVADHLDFTLLVNNLFNVNAVEPSLFSQALPDGVPLPGRNVMAQIRYRF